MPTVDIATPTQPSVRETAAVEHVFRVMKCQFGYRKVRYRGIAKNGAQVCAARARQPIPCPQDTRVRMKNTGAKASCGRS